MNDYNPTIPDESDFAKKHASGQSRKVFCIILICFAVAGCLLLAFSLLPSHKTGTVISVGPTGTGLRQSGTGKNVHKHKTYHTTVRVLAKDSSQTDTVNINVRNVDDLPKIGDEIEYANYWLTGNGLYPGGGVRIGIIILAADLFVFIVFLIIEHRKNRKYS